MGLIKLLNSFKSNPKDSGGVAAISFNTKSREFAGQPDMVFDATSLLDGHYPNREFASGPDIVTSISSDIDHAPAVSWNTGYGPWTIIGALPGTYTIRTRLYPTVLTGVGTKIRLTLADPISLPNTINEMWIGEAAPIFFDFGDGQNQYVDFLNPPIQVTFGGGNPGVVMSIGGGDVVSDEITYPWDSSKDLLTSYHCTGAYFVGLLDAAAFGGYRKSAVNEASTVDVANSTYTGMNRSDQIIKIEYL